MKLSNLRERRDEGFALPTVILVMVLVSALALASLMTTGDERAAGRALRESAKAFYAAEAGANAVISDFDALSYDTLMSVPGDSADLGWQTLENGSSYGVMLRRVDGGGGKPLYFVSVTGRGVGGLRGQRTIGVALRATTGSIATFGSAVFAPTRLRKNSNEGGITGIDQATADSCAGGGVAPVPGLKIPIGGLQYNDTTGTQIFFGDPETTYEGTTQSLVEVADPLAELQAMGIDWQGILDGEFDYTITQNPPLGQWPDFASLPPDAFPTILVDIPPDNRIDLRDDYNGRGLLVVPEELRINNDWEWDGVILVGNYFQSNGKMTIRGSIVAGLDLLLGRDPDDMKLSAIGPGSAQVAYNSCVIANAADSFAPGPVMPLAEGAWSQASN